MPWLLKSEPDVYSISDLANDNVAFWDGVRNYQARNFLKSMQIGERAFFYHSNCKTPGIHGLMEVCSTPYADKSAFDKKSKYYCSKSSPDNPRWFGVDFRFIHRWDHPLSLSDIKNSGLDFELTRKGNRLSVIKLENQIYNTLLKALNNINGNKNRQWPC